MEWSSTSDSPREQTFLSSDCSWQGHRWYTSALDNKAHPCPPSRRGWGEGCNICLCSNIDSNKECEGFRGRRMDAVLCLWRYTHLALGEKEGMRDVCRQRACIFAIIYVYPGVKKRTEFHDRVVTWLEWQWRKHTYTRTRACEREIELNAGSRYCPSLLTLCCSRCLRCDIIYLSAPVVVPWHIFYVSWLTVVQHPWKISAMLCRDWQLFLLSLKSWLPLSSRFGFPVYSSFFIKRRILSSFKNRFLSNAAIYINVFWLCFV